MLFYKNFNLRNYTKDLYLSRKKYRTIIKNLFNTFNFESVISKIHIYQ